MAASKDSRKMSNEISINVGNLNDFQLLESRRHSNV